MTLFSASLLLAASAQAGPLEVTLNGRPCEVRTDPVTGGWGAPEVGDVLHLFGHSVVLRSPGPLSFRVSAPYDGWLWLDRAGGAPELVGLDLAHGVEPGPDGRLQLSENAKG